MTKKTDSLFKEVLQNVNPGIQDLAKIRNSLNTFLKNLEFQIKKQKINTQIFIGGSFAKNTLIKKDVYDIDIFLRFDKKYLKTNISLLTSKLLKGNKIIKLKGSRDYFKIKIGDSIFFEIVPVIEVKNPSESYNITDLSYSHVNYIKKSIKSDKILDEIKIAKAFCYANRCYGAESYIKGFSGYGLELLVYHYKGFLNFVKAIAKAKDKIVIDLEKKYKNKRQILMDINASKLESPIILIDPTFKQRNVLAALSDETFAKFQKACKKFLKTPSIKSFELEKTDIDKIKNAAKSQKYEFLLLEAKTKKQEGDIAATKLLKFYKHLSKEIEKYFLIKNSGFNYSGKHAARFFFVVKNKEELIIQGPLTKQDKNVKKFKKAHKNTFIKLGKIYAREKINFNFKNFIINWRKNNSVKIKDMYVSELEII